MLFCANIFVTSLCFCWSLIVSHRITQQQQNLLSARDRAEISWTVKTDLDAKTDDVIVDAKERRVLISPAAHLMLTAHLVRELLSRNK